MTLTRLPLYLMLLLCLGNVTPLPALVLQSAPAADSTRDASAPTAVARDEEEPGNDVYRHSAAVKMMGGWLHMDKETAARTFEYLNFAVLAGAVLFALLKVVPKTFRENRANIQHQLSDARTATQQANERLAAIEKKLAQFDEEIAAISRQAEKDSVDDEARIKASMEVERQRIVDAATRDIAAAGSSAQRDLKRFAAGLAIDRARQRILLSHAEDRSEVQEFMQEFAKSFSHEQGKN